jgi:hypothetical protein
MVTIADTLLSENSVLCCFHVAFAPEDTFAARNEFGNMAFGIHLPRVLQRLRVANATHNTCYFNDKTFSGVPSYQVVYEYQMINYRVVIGVNQGVAW